VFRLILLAGAVFLFTVATTRDEPEPEPAEQLPDQPPETVEVRRPRTLAPGARVQLPAELAQAGSEPVEVCLQRWWMLDPALSGELVVELDLVDDQLQAWVLDHDELPEPVQACLAGAVFDLEREIPPARPWKERWSFPTDE
jgi:hypothetical protein